MLAPKTGAETGDRPSRVLVVDDDPDIARILGTVLRREGYDLRTAGDGDEAWQELSPEVDLVLLDIMLPGDSGPEILRRMQLDPMLVDIPVVFVTARSDPAIRMQCIAMGARGFLAKPFKSADVLAIVRGTIGEGRQAPMAEGPLEDELRAALGDPGGGGDALPGADYPKGELVQALLSERLTTRRALASQHRLISALFRLHRMSTASLPPERIGQGIVSLASGLLAASDVVLRIDGGTELVALAATAEGTRERVTAGDGSLTARAWREMLVTEGDDPSGGRELHVPLTAGGERLGLLSLHVDSAQRPSSTLATFFAAEAALALDSSMRIARAESQALVDPLTGVNNRRFLDHRLAEEIRRSAQNARELSVLFIDVDCFKKLNDGYGHAEGDRILRDVAGAIRAGLREMDVIARFGGEEFVVLLPDTGPDGARNAAERVRATVESRALRADGAPLDERVTVTVGVASFPVDADRATELIEKADLAMLRGKKKGRNRIESHGEPGRPDGNAAAVRVAPARRVGEARPRAAYEVIRALVSALGAKDRYSARHSLAVGAIAARVAFRLTGDRELARSAALAGFLHDIGKLETPDAVLLKPGPLTPDETVVMRRHADAGEAVVAASPTIRHLAPVVRASQEHFDGSGYPDGLRGHGIPVEARIVAAADAFHAMRSDRPYRQALSLPAAVAELRRCSGSQFDPVVIEVLARLVLEDELARLPRRRGELASAA